MENLIPALDWYFPFPESSHLISPLPGNGSKDLVPHRCRISETQKVCLQSAFFHKHCVQVLGKVLYTLFLFFSNIVYTCCTRTAFFFDASCTSAWEGFVHALPFFLKHRVHMLSTHSFFFDASCTSVWIDFVHRQFFFSNIVDRFFPVRWNKTAGIKKGPPFRMALVLQNTFSD